MGTNAATASILDWAEGCHRKVKEKLANYEATESGCWEYLGPKTHPSRKGVDRSLWYGKANLYWNGVKRTFSAHRLAYTFHYSLDPKELHVCHKCDNPICINPDHLFLGTHKDNMDDMRNKGRGITNPEQDNGNASLSRSQASEVIRRIQAGESNTSIAADYEISHAMVSMIRRGKNWTVLAAELGYEPKPLFKRKSAA